MDKEDYPSDSDQSDEDFCPENIDSDEASEEESDDNNKESEEDTEESIKRKNSRGRKKHSKQRKKISNPAEEVKETEDRKLTELGSDDETEKKRSDTLWADFLSDVNGSSKESGSSQSQKSSSVSCKSTSETGKKEPRTKSPEKVKVTKVFDFAGEEVKVTEEVPLKTVEEKPEINSLQQKPATKELSKFPRGPVKRLSGGLSSVLNSINKKTKISVLEKTKMDWNNFKQTEGLSEELQTFNKGRDGYLERQDFLERTDLRQFEIEKNLRQSRRSNR